VDEDVSELQLDKNLEKKVESCRAIELGTTRI